ncbi:hypothetical protein OROHE_010434 [Orobanche hederae]
MGAFQYSIGDGSSFFLWSDPWHHMGLIRHSVPRAPLWTGIDVYSRLIWLFLRVLGIVRWLRGQRFCRLLLICRLFWVVTIVYPGGRIVQSMGFVREVCFSWPHSVWSFGCLWAARRWRD